MSGWRSSASNSAADFSLKLVAINARVSSYHYTLASVYRRKGNTEEAKRAIEIFTRLEKESAELEQKRREASRR